MKEREEYVGLKCMTVSQVDNKSRYPYYAIYEYSLRLRKRDKVLIWTKGEMITGTFVGRNGSSITRSYDKAVLRAYELESSRKQIYLHCLRHNEELAPYQSFKLTNGEVPDYLVARAMIEKLTGERHHR